VHRIHLQPGRPLLPASARPWAGALVACCAILVAVLGALFAHQTTADRFDHAIDSQVIAWLGGHQGLLLWLAAPGSLIPAVVLCVAIVAACLLTGRLNGAVLAAAASVLVMAGVVARAPRGQPTVAVATNRNASAADSATPASTDDVSTGAANFSPWVDELAEEAAFLSQEAQALQEEWQQPPDSIALLQSRVDRFEEEMADSAL